MAEYLSKGTGVTLGTLGTIGFGTSILQALNNNNGNGLLGGLFCNNNYNQNSALLARIGELEAEKYSDKSIADLNNATDAKIEKLSDRIFDKYIEPMAKEIADSRVREGKLETQVTAMKENYDLKIQLETERLHRRIDNCCCETNGRINMLNQAVTGISQTLGSITNTVVPRTAICPEVMPRYNSFVTPTDNAPATQPVTGNINAS